MPTIDERSFSIIEDYINLPEDEAEQEKRKAAFNELVASLRMEDKIILSLQLQSSIQQQKEDLKPENAQRLKLAIKRIGVNHKELEDCFKQLVKHNTLSHTFSYDALNVLPIKSQYAVLKAAIESNQPNRKLVKDIFDIIDSCTPNKEYMNYMMIFYAVNQAQTNKSNQIKDANTNTLYQESLAIAKGLALKMLIKPGDTDVFEKGIRLSDYKYRVINRVFSKLDDPDNLPDAEDIMERLYHMFTKDTKMIPKFQSMALEIAYFDFVSNISASESALKLESAGDMHARNILESNPALIQAFELYGATDAERINTIEIKMRQLLLYHFLNASDDIIPIPAKKFIDNNMESLVNGNRLMISKLSEMLNSTIIKEHIAWNALDVNYQTSGKWLNLMVSDVQTNQNALEVRKRLALYVIAQEAMYYMPPSENLDTLIPQVDTIALIDCLAENMRCHNESPYDGLAHDPSCPPGAKGRIYQLWLNRGGILAPPPAIDRVQVINDVVKDMVNKIFLEKIKTIFKQLEDLNVRFNEYVITCVAACIENPEVLEQSIAPISQAITQSSNTIKQQYDILLTSYSGLGIPNAIDAMMFEGITDFDPQNEELPFNMMVELRADLKEKLTKEIENVESPFYTELNERLQDVKQMPFEEDRDLIDIKNAIGNISSYNTSLSMTLANNPISSVVNESPSITAAIYENLSPDDKAFLQLLILPRPTEEDSEEAFSTYAQTIENHFTNRKHNCTKEIYRGTTLLDMALAFYNPNQSPNILEYLLPNMDLTQKDPSGTIIFDKVVTKLLSDRTQKGEIVEDLLRKGCYLDFNTQIKPFITLSYAKEAGFNHIIKAYSSQSETTSVLSQYQRQTERAKQFQPTVKQSIVTDEHKDERITNQPKPS